MPKRPGQGAAEIVARNPVDGEINAGGDLTRAMRAADNEVSAKGRLFAIESANYFRLNDVLMNSRSSFSPSSLGAVLGEATSGLHCSGSAFL